MRVAIVGLSPSRADAPREGWQRWGLAWDVEALGFDRVFEMHDDWIDMPADYSQRLALFDRVYMQAQYLPNAVVYPFEEVAQTCGAYWESSIAYMLALAIHEGAEEIGLWGVDMKSDEEYGYQKPNVEYLLGLAKGRGIKTHIHDSSPLLKFSGKFGYVERYGRTKEMNRH
jgi:hypothetical protein